MLSKIKIAFLGVSLGILGILQRVTAARADNYGGGAVVDLLSGFWNEFWPLVALLFIVGIVLTVFGAPNFIKKIFGTVK